MKQNDDVLKNSGHQINNQSKAAKSFAEEFFEGQKGGGLYNAVKDLPIADYHCHLSPAEIFEDKPYSDIGEMWLAHDHYKWRLMRSAGVSERLITGDAPWAEKFEAYIGAVADAYGNPLRDWSRLELEKYFGVTLEMTKENAAEIRRQANAVIARKNLSPRKLVEMSHVVYIATTDDPADSLDMHKKIAADKTFKTEVKPTFRADNIFNLKRPGFVDYVKKLAIAAGINDGKDSVDNEGKVSVDFESFLSAIDRRMQAFKDVGCRFADIGIEDFPHAAADKNLAEKAFNGIISNSKDASRAKSVEKEEYDAYLAFMYSWWLRKCKAYGFCVQLHLNVLRNTNSKAFAEIGADSGFDTVADGFSVRDLKRVLDCVSSDKLNLGDGAMLEGGLPEIILYTLNPADYYPMITLAGSFRGVHMGIPWWFNDHKRGIEEYLKTVSELSHIGSVLGMLTDSRSFLSYARHDYFRMILCKFLAQFEGNSSNAQGGDILGSDLGATNETLLRLAENLSFFNTKKLIGLKG